MSLEDDVRDLVERQAIVDVINDYCYYVDLKDFDTMAEKVFAVDGTDHHGERVVEGRDAIRDWYLEEGTPNLASTVHAITNVRVERDGERARMHSIVTSWAWTKESADKGSLRPADYCLSGGYDDELTKYPEGWRVDKRVVISPTASVICVGVLPPSQAHAHALAKSLEQG
jgi:SnoaL-like domain